MLAVGFCIAIHFSLKASAEAPAFAPKANDVWVMAGDSITAQRLYTRFAEDFVLTRYPQMQITFFNAGVGGDTVNGGYTGDRAVRLNRDLFPRRPTVITIMLGMNDGSYRATTPEIENNFLNCKNRGAAQLLS